MMDDVLDSGDLLGRVGGSLELLTELVGIFRGESARLLEELDAAIEGCDADAVVRSAHCLKGAVSNLSAPAAFDAARRLEMIGRDHDLATAEAALASLRDEIDKLRPALERLTGIRRKSDGATEGRSD